MKTYYIAGKVEVDFEFYVEANSAEEAEAKFRETPVDTLVTDHRTDAHRTIAVQRAIG